MKYKDGAEVQSGDVIRWNCYDNEDFVTWTITGLYTTKGVVYLGGGIDFGMGIGAIISHESVVSESEDNEEYERGIEKVGAASKLANYISLFNDPPPAPEL